MVAILVLTILVSLLLMGVVLIQNSKGGGLASGFGNHAQMMGVRRTTDFLEKATWGLAAALLVLSLSSSFLTGGTAEEVNTKSEIKEFVEEEAFVPPAGFTPEESVKE